MMSERVSTKGALERAEHMGRILVIGSGFAGFWAAVAARRVAGTRADISLVSPAPVLEIRPRLYEAQPETLGVDVLPLLGRVGVTFVPGTATRLDASERAVTLASGERLPYDRLVVATGSQIRRPPVPGAETAYSVDSLAEAIEFDRRLAQIARSVEQPTIAVIGASFTGIELILELRDRLLAHNGNGVSERARLVLIDRSEVLGEQLGSGPRPVIADALAKANVELKLGVEVQSLAANQVRFTEGTVLDTDAVVLASGMVARPFAAQVPGERDPLGRVIVDATLKAPAAPEIFVAGDAAAADTGDGHWTLQSCQHAGQLGRVAGENAARDLLGLPAVPYTQLRYVTCLDLGRAGAVFTRGWDRQVEKTGSEAKAMKRLINTKVIYPPADGTTEALLASSTIDLAARASLIEGGNTRRS